MIRTLAACLVAVLFLTAVPSQAEEKASPQTVEELLKLIQIDKMLTAMTAQMEGIMNQSFQQAIAGKNLSPEAIEKSKEISKKTMTVIREELSPENMKQLYVTIYGDVFTEGEIRAIIDFYKTPAGEALITKQPIVMQKAMTFMQQKMGTLMPRVRKIAEDAASQAASEAGKK